MCGVDSSVKSFACLMCVVVPISSWLMSNIQGMNAGQLDHSLGDCAVPKQV